MMGITYGDHLIDGGYYDITPEQERGTEVRENLAAWMILHGFSTGHGDTIEDLITELLPQLEGQLK